MKGSLSYFNSLSFVAFAIIATVVMINTMTTTHLTNNNSIDPNYNIKINRQLLSLDDAPSASSSSSSSSSFSSSSSSSFSSLSSTSNKNSLLGSSHSHLQRKEDLQVFSLGITQIFVQPDGYLTSALTANGQIPGPAIRVKKGESFIVTVANKLPDQALTIHYHGLKMTSLPYFDGTPYGSQCPILPNQIFSYRVYADRPGTFWYHSHLSAQHAYGLFGPLIIDDVQPNGTLTEPLRFGYTEEHTLMFSDWFHRPMGDLLAGLENTTFSWIGVPDSILVNGKGVWNCSVSTTFPPPPSNGCPDSQTMGSPEIIGVEYGKTYRLRMINAASLLELNIEIENHNITIFEADGDEVAPYLVSNIEIDMGERYSVLLTANQPPGDYKIKITGDRANSPPGYAILRYQNPTDPTPATPVESMTKGKASSLNNNNNNNNNQHHNHNHHRRDETDNGSASLNKIQFDYSKIVAPAPVVVPRATRQIMIRAQQVKKPLGEVRWTLNGQASRHPLTPLIFIEALDLPYDPVIPYIEYIEPGEVIQLVLLNLPNWTNATEDHPFHLHGHSFFVLGTGTTPLTSQQLELDPNDFASALNLNLVNPPSRDQIDLPKNGWSVLRFVANNPGVWPFHCHLTWHIDMGMFMYFAYPASTIPALPITIPICGQLTPSYFINGINGNTGNNGNSGNSDSFSSGDFMKGWGVGFVCSAVLIGVVTLVIYKYNNRETDDNVGFATSNAGPPPTPPVRKFFRRDNSSSYIKHDDLDEVNMELDITSQADA